MIKLENKYILIYVSSFIFLIIGLASLINKYSLSHVYSLTETCKRMFEHYGVNSNITGGIILLLFVSIAVTLLGKFILSIIKMRSRRDFITKNLTSPNQTLITTIQNLGLENKVLIVNSRQQIAVVFGLWNPKIIISTEILNNLSVKELEAVLLHEKYHFNNRHTVLMFITEAVKPSLFAFPIFKELSNSIKNYMEYSANQFTIYSQKSSRYLNSAAKKVNSSDFSFLPAFSKHITEIEPKFNISTKSKAISALSMAFFLYLLIKPTEAKEIIYVGEMCESNECITRCIQKQQMSVQNY